MATAGFAYMASSNVGASSAGEGQGAVSGYTVSNITYSVPDGTAGVGIDYYGGSTAGCPGVCDAPPFAAIEGVSFLLTAQSTNAPANTAPSTVVAYPTNSGGLAQWGHDTCTPVSVWSVTAPGVGSGTYTCSFAPGVPVAALSFLDVEANQ
jgi:hypothetical protein